MSEHKKGLRTAVGKAVRQAEQRYKAENPDAENLRLKASVVAYKPRSKEAREVPIKAVALFLNDRSSLTRTNAQLAVELGRDIGQRVPANALTERFSAKQVARVQGLLEARRIALDLASHDTPSKVKKALISRAKSASAPLRFVGEVGFSDEAVTVGERAYPIQRSGGVARIHVGSSKLNVEVLKRLLCGTT